MGVKSPYSPVDIPELDIPTLLFEKERPREIAFPRDRKLFIDAKTGRGLSLEELHDQSRRFGQGLKENWNWQKGDVLCIFSVNHVETGIIVWGAHYKHEHYTSLFSKKHAESTRGKIKPTDLAFLAYSSGTTGLPKGVMLTHRNIVANMLQVAAIEMMEMHWTEDSMVSFLPFFHI